VLGNPYLDQNLDDLYVGRLEDHFEVKNLALGCSLSFDFQLHLIGLTLVLFPPSLEMLHFILVSQTTFDGSCIHIAIFL